MLVEALAHGPGLQTFDAQAQDLEQQIRQIWSVLDENPSAHTGSKRLASRVREVVDDLGRLKIDYDDWQIVYRQILQLTRALNGEPQVLEIVEGSRRPSWNLRRTNGSNSLKTV